MRQNHCSEISGSMRSPERCENGTEWVYGLLAADPALVAQRRDHRLAAPRRPPSPAKRSPAASVMRPSSPITVDLLEAVAAADLEVVGVVAGGDLERPGAELGVDVLVGDDLEPAADQRQDRVRADQVAVALVLGMHGDRGVGEHRLGAHRGDGEHLVGALDRVVDLVQGVLDLAVLDLEVGDRRAASRGPS